LGGIGEPYTFDAVIIGAGIIGLAIAEELSKTYGNILVLEKENSIGRHTSSRNSEIIHSGIYYPKNALKTTLCVEGNGMLYNFLKRHSIPHRKCGKLIVSSGKEESAILEELYAQGVLNGVQDMKFMNSADVAALEPDIKAIQAIFVPSTGIVDTHSIMTRLRYVSESRDVIFLYNSEINKIEKRNDYYFLKIKDQDDIIQTQIVINSAGLWSDKIARMAGYANYKLHWCKGEYYKTSKYKNMKTLIYPTPDPAGKYLGIHTVLDMDGNLSFGPNAYYVANTNYDVQEDNKGQFHESINRYLKIDWKDLSPSFSGIRPKLQAKGEQFRDFVIKNEDDSNFINLLGIESPGITCCLSIAKYVKDLII